MRICIWGWVVAHYCLLEMLRIKLLQRLERTVLQLCFLSGFYKTMVISKLEKDVKIPYNPQKIKTKMIVTGTPWICSKINIPDLLLFGVAKFRKNRNPTTPTVNRASLLCPDVIATHLLLWPSQEWKVNKIILIFSFIL